MVKKIVQVSAIDLTMNGLLWRLNQGILANHYKLICVCSFGALTEKMREEGLDVRSIQIDRNINLIQNVRSVVNLYKLFKMEKPDIVHVHTPIAAVLGRLAAKLAGVPHIVYTAHGFYFHENMSFIKYKVFLNIEKYLARFCTDFIFTQSNEDRLTAINNHFIDESKILTIGNGVDIWGTFNPLMVKQRKIEKLYQEFEISPGTKVITFIGRLVEEKGILDLLEAMKDIQQNNIKLLVVGNRIQGDRDQKTVNSIQHYERDQRILFVGYRSDIAEILFISDIFCLPSYREGMPRSIIEAMAMNCAVVATDIRGSREEVIHGETGFLVPLASPANLAQAIIELIDNETLLEEMKKRGRARAEELYDEEKIVDLQLDIFSQLLPD